MYQYEWFDNKTFEKETQKDISPDFKSKVDKENIKCVLLDNWQEHCHECAPPLMLYNMLIVSGTQRP